MKRGSEPERPAFGALFENAEGLCYIFKVREESPPAQTAREDAFRTVPLNGLDA